MTIPSFPWFAEVPNQEFGTSGFLENAARAAALPVNVRGWWGEELIGKSSFLPPVSLHARVYSPLLTGRDPRERPGYFNGTRYITNVAPVSENWVSVEASKGFSYSFTSNHDLGLRGYNVTDARLKELGFNPAQYLILDTNANQPAPLPSHKMKSPVLAVCGGRWDQWVYAGYFIGSQYGDPFATWVQKATYKDSTSGGPSWDTMWYNLPNPGPDQIITPAWYTSNSGDRIQFILIPWNAGYSEWYVDGFEYRYEHRDYPTPYPQGLVRKRNHFRHPDGPLATLDGVDVSFTTGGLTVKFVRPYGGSTIKMYMITDSALAKNNGNPFQEYILTGQTVGKVAGGYTVFKTTEISLAPDVFYGGYVRFFDSLSVQCILHPETAGNIWCYS